MNVPRIVYSTGPIVTLILSLPQLPWTPTVRTIGGFGISDSGAQAGFLQREDELVRVGLRFYQEEYANILTWLKWCRQNVSTPFTFWFDTAVPASARSVYMDSQMPGQTIEPKRDGDYLNAWQIEVTFRAVNGLPFTRAYWIWP